MLIGFEPRMTHDMCHLQHAHDRAARLHFRVVLLAVVPVRVALLARLRISNGTLPMMFMPIHLLSNATLCYMYLAPWPSQNTHTKREVSFMITLGNHDICPEWSRVGVQLLSSAHYTTQRILGNIRCLFVCRLVFPFVPTLWLRS